MMSGIPYFEIMLYTKRWVTQVWQVLTNVKKSQLPVRNSLHGVPTYPVLDNGLEESSLGISGSLELAA